MRVAVLLSGGGRSFENLVECSRRGEIGSQVVLAISSSRTAGGLERARRLSVPSLVVEGRGPELAGAVFAALDEARVDLACLAGWIKLLAPIPPAWKGRVLNIHPALLPSFAGKGFWGDKVHEAVLAAGVKVTGCTVHFCDDEYDHGPIVLQRTCPVLDDDDAHTLAGRVFEEEKKAYPEAVRLFEQGRLKIEGRRVRVLR
ncbi:MAG TPA: phosphoribosylglycinamide formyltransferase [Planctomycetota bacterium]|nr:phosphoribosylglycinamide formyltransferase [Planctomycetota bacterium]